MPSDDRMSSSGNVDARRAKPARTGRGYPPVVLLRLQARTMEWALVIGLVGVLCSRRDWLTRVAVGMIYLGITVAAFIYWGLSARGYMGKY